MTHRTFGTPIESDQVPVKKGLNQVFKTQFLFDSDSGPVTAPVPEAPPEVSVSTPLLQIDGKAKEENTGLVQRLFILGGAEGLRRVGFLCTESGDRKHLDVCTCGDILASLVDRSVCVVDCNFRSPALHQQFVVENHFWVD